jgi:hypothetical protein
MRRVIEENVCCFERDRIESDKVVSEFYGGGGYGPVSKRPGIGRCQR